MMADLVVQCPAYNRRKSQVWVEMNADSGGQKPQNEWTILYNVVTVGWGEKYLQFWLFLQFASHIWVFISLGWTY